MDGNEKIAFRQAGSADFDQLAALRWGLKSDGSEDAEAKRRFLQAFVEARAGETIDGPLIHWVAEREGQILAVMSVRLVGKVPAPGDLGGTWGYLTNSYTLPEQRNQGIGSALLAVIETWAREQKLELLIVWPSERSYPFYERAGFQRYRDPLVLKLQDDDE